MDGRELAQILARANEFKEGDLLVGGTRDKQERREAREHLSALRAGEITSAVLVEDSVSEALARSLSSRLASEISTLTIRDLKMILLGPDAAAWASSYRDGLRSEVIASVVKVMTDEELSRAARSLFNPLPGSGIGSRSHFGSRIQPNSAGDAEEEILFSILEGLSYGCGDVILGINPASDDTDAIIRLEELLRRVIEGLRLPTRYAVLSDIVKQTSARSRVKVDVGFQSLAGTSTALAGMIGMDVDGLLDLARSFDGLYFETGQGSAVTNGAAEGVDMVTLEARAYGLARFIQKQTGVWMIVNDVAGFIGPEVFRSPRQLLRACLEDCVMAKLHGIAMGLDVCSTFHMGIDPATLQQITTQAVERAAPAYLMAVAGNADPMLGYLTTSFRDHPRLRHRAKRQVSTQMQKRFEDLGVMTRTGDLADDRPRAESLYAIYMKAGGETRSFDSLVEEGRKKIGELRERGFDLGYGSGKDFASPPEVEARLEAIYQHARRALYSGIDSSVIQDTSPRCLMAETLASDREDYLLHPPSGEMIRPMDAARIERLYPSRRPSIQIVVSDGLNANAVNENLRDVLPPLKSLLNQTGHHTGESDIIIKNGRVRAGYHAGQLLGVDVIVHLIGERPGTGLNTLSAYLTYGRDRAGGLRWVASMDHASTTAICGIHHRGKHPSIAAEEIASCV
ncbi:MAG: ethanolamine ammonia-lyase subunit EutB, partial [Acidobacteriota bacterium]